MDKNTISLQLCSNPSDPISCCGSYFPNKTASGLCVLDARKFKLLTGNRSMQIFCNVIHLLMKLPQDGPQNPNLVNGRVPLNNVNSPSGAAADIHELMANCTAKKIQAAAKEIVNNSATVLEGSQDICAHGGSCPGTEAANVLGVVAKYFPETVSFNRSPVKIEIGMRFSLHRKSHFRLQPGAGMHNPSPSTQCAKCFALPSNMKLQPPFIYLEAQILAEEVNKFRGSTYTDIVVASVTIEVDDEAGVVKTTYPDLGDPELIVEKCEIAQELVGKGMSQTMRFQEALIGNERNQVTLLENREELYKEAARLHQTGWFLTAFLEHAQGAHINIDEDISVTQCELVVEVTKQGEAPSEASGYSLSDVESTECPMAWLIEPFQLGRAEKWSGTNQHPNFRKYSTSIRSFYL
ncbi:hypothetical protein DFH08DRAFT_812634 [Mycena albidolilacea]|uniref:Uncharacterized protein n=1 Tax=Mycena albidolilacea TaxID=1033008 RepID=A0AAD6ZUV0_9AGAR|nr:hypothetical protein DFH08DRAFT_812634 [Mycena albidolilacea]